MNVVRLVARQSRADAGLLALVALLVTAAAFLLAAFPATLSAIAQTQLRQSLEAAPAGARSLLATAPLADTFGRLPTESGLGAIGRTLRQVPEQLPQPVRDLVGSPEWIVATTPQTANEERQVVFALDPDWADRVRIVARADDIAADAVPVAVSASAAAAWEVEAGDPLGTGGAVVATVYEPADPDDFFWQVHPGLATPTEIRIPGSPLVQRATVVVAYEYLDALSIAFANSQIEAAWPIDADALDVGEAAEVAEQLRKRVAKVQNLPTGPPIEFSAGSAATIDRALDRIQAGSVLFSLAAVGPLALLLLSLGLGAGAIRERRAVAIGLLRARGASAGGLRTTSAVEAAVVAVPAAVVGAAVAGVFGSVLGVRLETMAAVVGACVAAAVPVAVLALLGGGGGRRSALVRTVVEVLVVVAAAASVALVLRRGLAGADPLLLAAPVLVAAATAVGVVRAYPILARGMLAVARRRRGAAALVGAAQTLHAPSVGAAAAFALVVAGASVSFSLALLPGVGGEDALALGLRALLIGGAVVCAVLASAAVALGVSAARRRRIELLAVLRALGMPAARLIALWASVPVIVLAVALGLVLGIAEAVVFAGVIAAVAPPS